LAQVSIIIPYYNEDLSTILGHIENCIDNDREKKITFKLSVICINNGGEEYKKATQYSYDVHFIEEKNQLNSPYSARNRGIEYIKSDWYIFIDATCLPNASWLNEIQGFSSDNIYAANVTYYTQSKATIGDSYDSIINVDNERTIKSNGSAKTACLGVSNKTLKSMGLFEEGLRSGGDVLWTQKCTEADCNLIFSPNWNVAKESRNTTELIRKQFRVSIGWSNIWLKNGTFVNQFVKKVLLCFLPPNPQLLFKIAKRRGVNLSLYKKIKLVSFGTLLRVISAVGVVCGMFKKKN